MAIRIKLEGLPEIEKAFEGVPKAARRAIEAKALPAAGEIVRGAIEQRVPTGKYRHTGRLRKSIEMRQTQIAGDAAVVVLPSRKRRGSGGRYAHLVEYGTAPHAIPRGKSMLRHPGAAARAFFMPGVDASQDHALDTLEQLVGAETEAYWASLGGGAS